MTQVNSANSGVLNRLGVVGFNFEAYQPLFQKMGVSPFEFTAMLYAQIVAGWNWNTLAIGGANATANATGNATSGTPQTGSGVFSGGTGELRNIGIRALPILQGVLDGLCAVFNVAIPQSEGLRAAS